MLLREVAGALSRGPLGLPETNADKELSKFSLDVHVNGENSTLLCHCRPFSQLVEVVVVWGKEGASHVHGLR